MSDLYREMSDDEAPRLVYYNGKGHCYDNYGPRSHTHDD